MRCLVKQSVVVHPWLYSDCWLMRHERCSASIGRTASLEASDNWSLSTKPCLAAPLSSTPSGPGAHWGSDHHWVLGPRASKAVASLVTSLPSWVKNQQTHALITSLVIQVTQVSLQFYIYTEKSIKTQFAPITWLLLFSVSQPILPAGVHWREHTASKLVAGIITEHTKLINKTTQLNNCPRSLRTT